MCKYLSYILLVFPVLAFAQSQDQNYIKTTSYKVPTSQVTPSEEQKIQTITYYDGLGKPIQEVAYKQSSSGKDIVTPIDYDDLGRQTKEYLPYVPTSVASQNYVSTALTDVLNYPEYVGQIPFSDKQIEASSLNRVMKQSASGNDWALGSGHEIKFDYQTNSALDAVKLFNFRADWDVLYGLYKIPTSLGTNSYAINQLYKTITYDENTTATPMEQNGSTVEFKDKDGRVVLKRTYSNVGTGTTMERHNTYYVYDQFGNLTFVIPPKADGAITSDVLNNLCYQYKYDYRNRLVEKKLPGKQWEFIVYDKLDRVIATGPAFSPFSDLQTVPPAQPIVGWIITKYDVFGRPVYTGWEQSTTVTSAGRFAKQNTANSLTNFDEVKSATPTTIDGITDVYYTNTVAPTTFKLLSVNYYDDYNFQAFTPAISYVTGGYNNSDHKPKGLSTGSWTRMLTTSSSTTGERSYTIYDDKARPVKAFSLNHLGGYTQIESNFDFMGKVLYTETRHKRTDSSTEIFVREDFNYSDQDRLLSHYHKVGVNGTPQLIAENTYDELGKLTSKKVGNTSSNPLQKVDYTYNIRGWLSEINKTGWDSSVNQYPLNVSGEPNDLFAFKINYNTVQNETNYTGKALYNGNIAETYWRTSGDNSLRKYGYFYDDLNRLRNSVYQKPFTSVPVTNMYNESMSYDKNGNIKTLQRNGDFDAQTGQIQIDNLNYFYKTDTLGNETNQLAKVTDDTNSDSSLGFKNGTNTDDDYSYDANGNLISDKNKSVKITPTTSVTLSNVKYNHLNLPTEIFFASNKKINYIYNAVGQKTQKIVTIGTTITTTDYLSGGFQYENTVLKFFPHAEGYVNHDEGVYKYVFNYTDHLGNVRVSYTQSPTTNTPVIMEQNHYYPFGLKHTNYNVGILKFRGGNPISSIVNPYKYKFGNKEFQDDFSINMYDFGARNYDPALGRWMSMDAMSEKYYPISSYCYALNNPNYFVDPDGNYIEIYYGEDSKKKSRYEYQKDRDYSKIKDSFLSDAYKALDALYVASNIEVDGETTNLIQTLMDDKRELSVVEGGEQGGSHFAKGRDFESKGKWFENSKNVIGTIHLNTKEGNLYDDVNNTSGKELRSLYDSNNLSKHTRIVSATSIFGHEIAHAFNYATKPSDYRNRVNDISTQNYFPYFKNAEEAKATTLSNLININLGEPQRNNYRAIGVPTVGVLSNQIKK